ncbi:MAG: hypothetical protein ABSC92_10085, partial [Rhizomicrobium sp.]
YCDIPVWMPADNYESEPFGRRLGDGLRYADNRKSLGRPALTMNPGIGGLLVDRNGRAESGLVFAKRAAKKTQPTQTSQPPSELF